MTTFELNILYDYILEKEFDEKKKCMSDFGVKMISAIREEKENKLDNAYRTLCGENKED